MKTWHIWDFPDDLYILLKKNIHKEFFNEMFKKYGGKRPYARFLGLSQMGMKNHWRRYTKGNNKIYIQYTPLWVFKRSCKTNKLKRKIERGIKKIRVRSGTPINNLKLTIKESPALYRIVAHLIGDGFAGKRKVPYYANMCKKLRQQFKKDLQIFGKIKTYERTPNTTPCLMFPKVISDILRYIFDIEFTRPSKLPKEIFSASKGCKRAFLQALFDDEGTISANLVIGMVNLNIIQNIKGLVENLGVETNKISIKHNGKRDDNFTFSIKNRAFKKFKEGIGFSHPKKIKNLEAAIKTQERNKIQRTRTLEWTRNKILNLLKNKPMQTLDLCKNLLLTMGGLYHHLNYLEKNKFIKRTGYKNKILWTKV